MPDHCLPIQIVVVSDASSEGSATSFPAGSTYPSLVVELRDASGEPIDLSGAVSATLSLHDREQTIVDAGMDFEDREQGRLSYRWRDADVAEPGLYRGRVTVRFRDGRSFKAPTADPLTVRLTDRS